MFTGHVGHDNSVLPNSKARGLKFLKASALLLLTAFDTAAAGTNPATATTAKKPSVLLLHALSQTVNAIQP